MLFLHRIKYLYLIDFLNQADDYTFILKYDDKN